MSVRNGKPVNSGRAMTPRNVPQHGIDAGPEHALWPNQSHRKSVSTKASLVGTHHVTGDGMPDSLQFDLGRDHDFLPELRSEEHTSEIQSLMRIPYAFFCLNKTHNNEPKQTSKNRTITA